MDALKEIFDFDFVIDEPQQNSQSTYGLARFFWRIELPNKQPQDLMGCLEFPRNVAPYEAWSGLTEPSCFFREPKWAQCTFVSMKPKNETTAGNGSELRERVASELRLSPPRVTESMLGIILCIFAGNSGLS